MSRSGAIIFELTQRHCTTQDEYGIYTLLRWHQMSKIFTILKLSGQWAEFIWFIVYQEKYTWHIACNARQYA